MIRVNLTYNTQGSGNTIEVGTGSGELVITQSGTGAVAGDNILIAPGTYDAIRINNFSIPEGETIYIKNNSGIVRAGEMTFDNVSGLIVSGDNGQTQGFQFIDVAGRAIKMSTFYSRVTLSHMLFKNIGDYCVAREASLSSISYLGTPETRADNLKFLHLEFWNANGIQLGGYFDSGTTEDKGYIQGVEVANCYFHDTPNAGSVINGGNVQGFNVHHNTFTALNASNNNHNGLTLLEGQGDYHHNYLHNYQGNAIRVWCFSRGLTPLKSKVYNNICSTTRKYGCFEAQSFARYLWSGKSTTGIIEYFNNTGYYLAYEGDYHGVLLDKYGMEGSVVDAWNNVCVNLPYPDTLGGQPSYMWGTSVPDNTYDNTNRYYTTLSVANMSEDNQFNILSASSPLVNGEYRADPYPIDDIYGNPRNPSYVTIGAVAYVP